MSKPWLSREPTTHRSVAYSPAAEALADMLHDTFRCLQFGVACAGGHALLTSGSDIGGTGWAGLGGFCFLLAAASFADIAGPTIGQVGAEWQFALESRRAGRVDDDDWQQGNEAESPRTKRHTIDVRTWEKSGELPSGEANIKQAQFYSLDLTERQARELAAFVESGASFSESNVCKACKHIGSTRWDELRPQLLTNGLIRWKRDGSPTLGVEVTAKFHSLARVILQYRPTG